MTLLERIELLKRIDGLIRRKATGKPEDLANRLGVSRTSVFRHLKDLKEMGAPIIYCKPKDTYVYTESFVLKF